MVVELTKENKGVVLKLGARMKLLRLLSMKKILSNLPISCVKTSIVRYTFVPTETSPISKDNFI